MMFFSEEKLLCAISAGDEAAINTAINRYSRLLWSVVQPILQPLASAEEVEECVADVFIQLWQQPQQFDPARGSLKSYLCLLARSKAIDRYRSLSRRAVLPLEAVTLCSELGLEAQLLQAEAQEQLNNALQQLTEAEQEILLRRYYYGQKPRQIALALQLPNKQVENHLYRSKQKLQSILTSEQEV